MNCGIHFENGANGLLANVPIFRQLNIHMLPGGVKLKTIILLQYCMQSIFLGKLNYNSLVSNPVINRSIPQIRPSFCNLRLSTKCRGRGLYARCDIFSCNYVLPSGAPPTTSCPDRRRQRIWRLCRLEGCYSYLWQSHVEIESYSIVRFDCIPAPYRWSSIKGGAQRAL